MRSVTTALGSFVLGALCSSLFGGHISIGREPVLAFDKREPSVFDGNAFTPIVPTPARSIEDGGINEYQVVQLDGANISNSVFRDPTFVYGGGAYSLRNSAISGNINFHFIGAAANTVQFLASFGLLGGGPPPTKPAAPEVNTPKTEKTVIKTTIKGDFVSPYSGK